ncbi:2211_t:CDS:2, partial [Cetraspora pellucida]
EQLNLNNILIALQQIQQENQLLRQENIDVHNKLNQLMQEEAFNQLRESKVKSALLNNFDGFIKEFKATFGNSDKIKMAANRIRKLTQGSKLASSYTSEFHQISSNLDWKKAVLINQFQTGLRNDVKDLLLTIKDPTTLNDAISKTYPTIVGPAILRADANQ